MRGYLDPPEVPRRAAAALRAALGDALLRVSLFGSRARGDADPASDYDLLVVVSRRDPQVKRAVYAVTGDFLADHRVDLSAKVLSASDFEGLRSSGLPFWERFARDEVVLWPRPS